MTVPSSSSSPFAGKVILPALLHRQTREIREKGPVKAQSGLGSVEGEMGVVDNRFQSSEDPGSQFCRRDPVRVESLRQFPADPRKIGPFPEIGIAGVGEGEQIEEQIDILRGLLPAEGLHGIRPFRELRVAEGFQPPDKSGIRPVRFGILIEPLEFFAFHVFLRMIDWPRPGLRIHYTRNLR